MVLARVCNGAGRGLQFAIEELIESVEGLQRVSNVISVQLPTKGLQKLVNLLHDIMMLAEQHELLVDTDTWTEGEQV